MSHPDRIQKLVVVSVGHPSVPWSLRQIEMAWYAGPMKPVNVPAACWPSNSAISAAPLKRSMGS